MVITVWKPIGAGVEVSMMLDHRDRYTGMLYRHECKGGRMDQEILFDLPWNHTEQHSGKEKWRVETWEPLTISPSLGCTSCGLHGWIRDGTWITDIAQAKKLPDLIDPVTVCLTLDGGPPILIGKYSSNIRARDLSGERRDLAVLLRAYADRLDNES